MKRFSLPPEIGWPLFVIVLLLASVGTGMSIVYFAQSDGGVQVVDRSLPQPANEQPQADTDRLPADADHPQADQDDPPAEL